MERKLLEEINKVRQVMGVIHEQEREIINQNGKRIERVVSDVPPYESKNWRAEFASGKFSSSDLDGTPDLMGLVEWLNNPKLKNTNIVVAVTAGTSRVPVSPGGDVAKALEAMGKEPTNTGLAIARGETAIEMVKDQIKSLIPEEIFNNIEFTVDLSKLEQGPDWDGDDATALKYETHQFLSTIAYSTGQEETLTELPDICNGTLKGSGGKAEKKNKGPGGIRYAAYTENDVDGEFLGKHYDLGMDTVGMMTFSFNAIRIPDMFQVTYNNQTYTSSGVGGEGFVSNSFKGCGEGTSCYKAFMKDIDRLKGRTEKESKVKDKAEIKKGRLKTQSWKMLIGSHGYKPGEIGDPLFISADKFVTRDWITEFFKRFTPLDFSAVGGLFKNKKAGKYNPEFTDGWSRYTEMADGSWDPGNKAKVVTGKSVWDDINDLWIKLDDNFEKKEKSFEKASGGNEKEIQKLQNELNDLIENGNPNSYAKAMTRKLRWLGFDQGVIGENGSVQIEKVKGAADMYLQVYAPLDSTAWRASVTCKDLKGF